MFNNMMARQSQKKKKQQNGSRPLCLERLDERRMLSSNTFQNFDDAGTGYTATAGVQIVPGGPQGQFLRLTEAINSQSSFIAFDATNALDSWSTISASFDFRIGGGGTIGADGLSFALLDTDTYGDSGAAPSYLAEEPNLTNSFGIGFDTRGDFPNLPSTCEAISLHFDNAWVADAIVESPALCSSSQSGLLRLDQFHRASISIVDAPQLGGSLVSVSVRPDVYGAGGPTVQAFSNYLIAGFSPYKSRVAFGARTGGFNDRHEIDNVNVQWLRNDVTQPGDPLIASSDNSPAAETGPNAIDDQPTKYLNFDTAATDLEPIPSGFVVSPSAGFTLVEGISLQSANDAPERDPKSITLEGSNDANPDWVAGNWIPIYENTSIPSWVDLFPTGSRFQTQRFAFANTTPYRHYRWTVNEIQGAGNGMQIAEVELLGQVVDVGNTPPTFTSPPLVFVPENSTAVQTIAATDVDVPPQPISFRITGAGADDDKFQITDGNQLAFIEAPDFEALADSDGDNVYQVELEADDNNGLTTTQTVFVAIVNENEPPIVAAPISDVSVEENPPNTLIDLSTTFIDIDAGDSLTFAVSDNSNPTLVSASILGSVLTLDYQNDQSGSAVITVRATDSGQLSVEESFTVVVSSSNPGDQTIDSLIGQVDLLEAEGRISGRDARSLRHRLTGVQSSLERGRSNAAANRLRAFVGHVVVLVFRERISKDDASDLVTPAFDIITSLRSDQPHFVAALDQVFFNWVRRVLD